MWILDKRKNIIVVELMYQRFVIRKEIEMMIYIFPIEKEYNMGKKMEIYILFCNDLEKMKWFLLGHPSIKSYM